MYLAHVQAVGVGVRGDVLAPRAFAHIEPYARGEEHLEETTLTVLYVTVSHGFDGLTCDCLTWL